MTAPDLRAQLRATLDPPRRGELALAWLAGAPHLVISAGPASFAGALLVVGGGRLVVCPNDRLTALPPVSTGPGALGPGARHG